MDKINKIILLILLQLGIIFSCSNTRISSTKLINLKGQNVVIDRSKINYFIVLSTQSCHQCYKETQDYILKNNFYNDTSIVINIIAIDTKENIETVSIRKNYYNISKEYFPQLANVYYSDKLNGKYISLFGEKISVIGNLIIFVMKNKEIRKYNFEEFILQ